MNIKDLAKNLDISVEKLNEWIQALDISFPHDDNSGLVISEAWVPYFRQVKTLFAAGRQAAEIRQAVPLPEGGGAAQLGIDNRETLQETLRQLEMQIVSLQFYLKNTQGEMVKEQKNLAKVQKQVEDMNRTVDVLQRQLSSAQRGAEKLAQFLSRFWLYQGLTVLVSVLLALILGRMIMPPPPKVPPAAPVASSTETTPRATDGLNAEPTTSPSPETTATP